MANLEPLREDDPAAVGAYRLLGRLGAGGQGTVYLGQGPDGRHVAVKVLRDGAGFDDRLAKEIAAARRVEPFCIAQVLDASLGAQPYIVTEYVEGPSLQEAGRHTGAALQRLAVATATALAAIHEAGVVHRDFKPANVLLGPGGPRVIDFGIARAFDEAVTHTSGIVGTPAYMAPEQLGGQVVGPPADVFAWASVMVWAATGMPPFGQDTLPAIINRILNNEPQLGDLPQPMRSIVYACLAKDPQARPTMRDVILRLLSGQNPMPGQQPGAAFGSGPQGPTPGQQGSMPGPHGSMPGFHGSMPGSGPMPVAGSAPGMGPGPGMGSGPGMGASPGMGPAMGMGPGDRPGPFPGHGTGGPQGPGQGGRRRAAGQGRRIGVPLAVGLSCAMVVALVGGVVWLMPTDTEPPTSASLSATTPGPSANQETTKRPSTKKPPKSGKPTTKKTGTAKPTTSSPKAEPTTREPTREPAPDRTTTRPTPARTTKKPAVNARASILEIELSEGPGGEPGQSCLMPPVHFQSLVESTKREIWVSFTWVLDGKTVVRNRSWVPENEYTAFATSGQYMLDAGRHTVTLKVSSPSVTSKSRSFTVCAMPTW